MSQQNIVVAVRVRPLPARESHIAQETQFIPSESIREIVTVVDRKALIFDPTHSTDQKRDLSHGARRRRKEIRYAFDTVLDVSSSQIEVFEATSKPLIPRILEGFNATVFAYGATGCGKTHTITGTKTDPGLIYQTVKELFTQIDRSTDKVIDATISYLEVYNETIRDLLVPDGTVSNLLDLREDDVKVVVSGLSHHRPDHVEHVMEMLIKGNNNRTKAFTEANAVSSRSHAVLQIHVRSRPTQIATSIVYTNATLSIIDLAGSERASVTKNKGDRLLEGANINRSLLALGNCINALCSDKPSHVPYRDSKLTRLLKYSLQGNCKVVMIANISPANVHYEETHNTLKYANRAKNIRTTVSKNEHATDMHFGQYPKLVESLQSEIDVLRAQLQAQSLKLSSLTMSHTNSSLEGNIIIFDELIAKLRDYYAALKDRELVKIGYDTHIKVNEVRSNRIKSILEIITHPSLNAQFNNLTEKMDLITASNVALVHSANTIDVDIQTIRAKLKKLTTNVDYISTFSTDQNNELNYEIGRLELILHNSRVSKQSSLFQHFFEESTELPISIIKHATEQSDHIISEKIINFAYGINNEDGDLEAVDAESVYFEDENDVTLDALMLKEKASMPNIPLGAESEYVADMAIQTPSIKRVHVEDTQTVIPTHNWSISKVFQVQNSPIRKSLSLFKSNSQTPVTAKASKVARHITSALGTPGRNPFNLFQKAAMMENQDKFLQNQVSISKILQNPLNTKKFSLQTTLPVIKIEKDPLLLSPPRKVSKLSPNSLLPPTPQKRIEHTLVSHVRVQDSGPIRSSPAKRIQRNHARQSMIPILTGNSRGIVTIASSMKANDMKNPDEENSLRHDPTPSAVFLDHVLPEETPAVKKRKPVSGRDDSVVRRSTRVSRQKSSNVFVEDTITASSIRKRGTRK